MDFAFVVPVPGAGDVVEGKFPANGFGGLDNGPLAFAAADQIDFWKFQAAPGRIGWEYAPDEMGNL